MVDRHTPEQRQRNMRAASRQKDTAPEMELRRGLTRAGLTGYRLHRRDVPGKPDLAWIGARVAVFVDGAFWHGHPRKFRKGRSEWWDRKIAQNVERDRQVNELLEAKGWQVIRLWDFEIAEDLAASVDRVRAALGR